MHGIRRRFTPQQVIAQRLGTAVGQTHRVLIDDIGKDTATHGKRALGEQVVADHHDLARLAGRNECIRHQLGAHGEHAADQLGGIRAIETVHKLALELLDLGMRAGKVFDLPGNIVFAQVRMEGAGGQVVRIGIGIARQEQHAGIGAGGMRQVGRLLGHQATRRGIIGQAGAQAVEMRTVAIDKLNRHARLGNLLQQMGRTIIARNVGKQAVDPLAHLKALIDMLERIGITADTKLDALDANALVDDLLLKAVAALPQVTIEISALARCARQAKHQVDILATKARSTRVAVVAHLLGFIVNLCAHGLAHAGLARQGFMHGIDGNAKLGGYVLHGYASAHRVTPVLISCL